MRITVTLVTKQLVFSHSHKSSISVNYFKFFVMGVEKPKKGKAQKLPSVSIFSNAELAEDPKESLQEKCKKYYRNSRKKYNDYFLKCIEEIESLQPSAFACVQAMRYFVVGILPQYCFIPDPLTKEQRKRVEKILGF